MFQHNPTAPTNSNNMSAFGAPLQAMAMPNIQVDDDDILMDYEDEVPTELSAAPPADAMTMDAPEAPRFVDEEVIAPERVHLRGVDNLNTAQIKAYASEHFPTPPQRLEWIDDTSLNLVYENPALARAALAMLSEQAAAEELPLLQLRFTKPFSQSPDSRLSARIARPTDRKEPGARERSRYYLFHPEEDRGERRERHPRSHNSRERERGDYSRRYYDSREDGVRRRNEEFAEDMYDDAGPKRKRTRSRSRSRSPRRRSPPPRRRRSPQGLFPDSRRRSRSPRRNRGVELFPEYTSSSRSTSRPKELFPEKTSGSKELFPESTTRSSAAMDAYPIYTNTHTYNPSPPAAPRELFPASKPMANSNPFATKLPKSLAERITMPAKSLAERISLHPSPNDDLFAEKMAGAKGEALYSDSMGSSSRRHRGRRGRKKADEFM